MEVVSVKIIEVKDFASINLLPVLSPKEVAEACQNASDAAVEETIVDAETETDTDAKSSVIYISSLKGGFQLCLDGYPFTRHRNRDDTTYWRCVQFKPLGCKARVRTKVYGKRLEIVQREHNHTILTERRKKGVLKAMMAEKKNKVTESDNNDSAINT